MSNTEKFYFDKNNFDDPRPGDEEDKIPKVTLIEEEYEAEKKQIFETAFEKGKNEGRQLTQQSIDAEISEKISDLGGRLGVLAAEEERRNQVFEKEALAAAYQAFLALFPSMAEKLSLEEIEKFVREKLEANPTVAKFEITVHPKLEQNLNERIQAMPVMQTGKMDVEVASTEEISEYDIRIKWADGGVKRSLTNVKEAIEKAFQEFLALEISGQEMPSETAEEGKTELPPIDVETQEDEKPVEVEKEEEIVAETDVMDAEDKAEETNVEQEEEEQVEKGLEDSPDKQ